MNIFCAADLLIPKQEDLDRWAVIACDQFTADHDYWNRVAAYVGDRTSSLNLILPEAWLTGDDEKQILNINDTMTRYLQEEIFDLYSGSYVYIERTMASGRIRRGILGAVDLDQYDFDPDHKAAIRATEQTVRDRLPPRMRTRRGAALELSHTLMLYDDRENLLLDPVSARKDMLPKLYDIQLMEDGGKLRGWLLQGNDAAAFDECFARYAANCPDMILAVGDGNHSLAAAKECFEELKRNHPGVDLSDHPARYALVELVNIHDEAVEFLPIHRALVHTDPEAFTFALKEADPQMSVDQGVIHTSLDIFAIQEFLDRWVSAHPCVAEYPHEVEEVRDLAALADGVGILVPPFEKKDLFPKLEIHGLLPRKAFSIGRARDKRYYLEGRSIR